MKPCSLSQTVTPSNPHSLKPSLPQTFTPSLTHSLTPSNPHSLKPSLPHSLTPSLPQTLTPSNLHSISPTPYALCSNSSSLKEQPPIRITSSSYSSRQMSVKSSEGEYHVALQDMENKYQSDLESKSVRIRQLENQ